MAHGQQITSNNYPYLLIRLELRGNHHQAWALLDTVFTGYLVVPTKLITTSIGVPDARLDLQLADSSVIEAPAYFATLELVGLPSVRATVTALGNEYILGRRVIDRFSVTLDHGRRVIVKP